MSLVILTPPPTLPVKLDEAKDHLNIRPGNDQHDSLVERKLASAVRYCENYMGRTLIRTQYQWKFDQFPSWRFVLPKAPIISIDSITVTDGNASPNVQTVATSVYSLEANTNSRGFIYLNYGQTWPTNRNYHNDITVNFTAGYQDSQSSPRDYDDLLPADIKDAILLVLGDLFLNRETRMDVQTYKNDTADNIMNQYRIMSTSS